MTTYVEQADAEFKASVQEYIVVVLAELSQCTSLEKALPLYAGLLDLWKELGQEAKPFEACAPLLPPVPADFDALLSDAIQAVRLEQAKFEQKIKFDVAFSLYKEVAAAHGSESGEAMKLFAKVLEHTPPDIMKMMKDKAHEMGLVPPASGYLESGEPVYTLDAIAKQLGCSVEDLAHCPVPEGFTVDAASVHRVQ